MKVKAQYAMVLNLDKCIGCHTCSIPCKNVWPNRDGAEYMWFNNVEFKPGIGYPKPWENQELYKGGWHLRGNALKLKAGGRVHKGLNIFHNPDLPVIDDYYEPCNYDYARLIESPKPDPSRRRQRPRPVGRRRSRPRWGRRTAPGVVRNLRSGPRAAAAPRGRGSLRSLSTVGTCCPTASCRLPSRLGCDQGGAPCLVT